MSNDSLFARFRSFVREEAPGYVCIVAVFTGVCYLMAFMLPGMHWKLLATHIAGVLALLYACIFLQDEARNQLNNFYVRRFLRGRGEKIERERTDWFWAFYLRHPRKLTNLAVIALASSISVATCCVGAMLPNSSPSLAELASYATVRPFAFMLVMLTTTACMYSYFFFDDFRSYYRKWKERKATSLKRMAQLHKEEVEGIHASYRSVLRVKDRKIAFLKEELANQAETINEMARQIESLSRPSDKRRK